jgi:hypothetical protein
MKLITAATLALVVLGALPAAGMSAPAGFPTDYHLYTNGQHDIDPGATKTDSWLNTSSGFSLYQYSHYHSGGQPGITVSSSNQIEWESATYTNWSTRTDHYAQTWAYFANPNPDYSNSPHDESPNPLPLSADATALTAPKPPVAQRTIPIPPDLPVAVAARCPAGYLVAHAEGEILWKTRALVAEAPEPVVTETLHGATARVRAGDVKSPGGLLKILVHCAGNGETLYGWDAHLRIGSNTNDRTWLGHAGEVHYAGRGHDWVQAGGGDDVVYGDGGHDELVAGAGSDVLDGGRGDDILRGGAERTLIRGGPGRDMVIGGSGRDLVWVNDGSGGDTVRCGRGRDFVMADRGDKVAADCEEVRRAKE